MSPSVAVVTGRLFRGSEMDLPTQAAAGSAVRAAAAAALKRRDVYRLYGALACGVDIVVAEVALDLGIAFHGVLPFALPHFVKRSVDIGDPPGSLGIWRARFEAVLARAASVAIAEDTEPLERDLDSYFYYGFRFMAGLALMHARASRAQCRLIAVTDGKAPEDIASSSRAVADWRAAGRAVDLIELPDFRNAPAPRPRRGSAFRPCVYLSDVQGRLATALAEASGANLVPLPSYEGATGICIVAASIEAAIRLAEAVAAGAGQLRILCDFGPVLGGDLQPDVAMIAARAAASAVPRIPGGAPVATLNFAAQAATEFGDRLDVREAGRVEEGSRLAASQRSGLALYRLTLAEMPEDRAVSAAARVT